MWELRASSSDRLAEVFQQLQLAIEMAPEEGLETRRKNEQAARETVRKARVAMTQLEHCDRRIVDLYADKAKLRRQLTELYQPVNHSVDQFNCDQPVTLGELVKRMRKISARMQDLFDGDNLEEVNDKNTINSTVVIPWSGLPPGPYQYRACTV